MRSCSRVELLGGALLSLLVACGTSEPHAGDAGRTAQDAMPSDTGPVRDAVVPAGDTSGGGSLNGPPDTREASAPTAWVAYASGYAPAIQWLSVSAATGALTPTSSVASFGTSPSFLAVDGASRHLYAVDESTPGRVGAYDIDPTTGGLTFLNAVSSGGDGPPFVAVDGPWVFVANYWSGSVAVLSVQGDGSLGAAVDVEMPGALAHSIVADPSDRFVFVPCKGSDHVAQFLFDASTGKLTPNAVPTMATAAGAGPRHLAFHPNGTIAYLIDETDSTMSELSLDVTNGTLSILQTMTTRPAGATGTNTAAEVHVHPSGKWLFGSNRGDDDIVVFALDASGRMSAPTFTKTGGTTPRDFAFDAAGAFLYAANQGSGNVVTFRFDASAGTLTQAGAPVTAASASFIGLAPLP
jgi:6-phosphogluconolactonase